MPAPKSKPTKNDKVNTLSLRIKRIKYDRTKIKDAIYAVKHGNMGIREASRVFKIPRTTLQDRINGRIDEESLKIGRETVLNEREEDILVQWLIQLAKCGFPRKRSDLINTVANIVKEDGRPNSFKDGRPGSKWYNLFMRRHPILSERTAEVISQARAIVTEEYIRNWFGGLKSFLRETGNEDILHDSRRILNGDETSFSICPKSGKVIGPKGWKNIYEITKGSEKETITVLLVITASGESIPPMVVFPYIRRPPKEIVNSAPSTWFIGISDSGWMRSGLFFEYIANGVSKWVTDNNIPKPILLLVDGHKSHLTKDLSIFCEENDIILYALPPNTTHIMQPADVSVFRPLKHQWRKTVKEWQDDSQNCNRTLNKITFCPLLSETLKQLTTDTIKNGFKKCGLFPFNPDAVDYTKCVKNTQENMFISEISKNSHNISHSDLETTLKVLNICQEELKYSGIDLVKIENIITHKKENKDHTHLNSTIMMENKNIANITKKDGPIPSVVNPAGDIEEGIYAISVDGTLKKMTDFEPTLNTSANSVTSMSILEAPDSTLPNLTSALPPFEVQNLERSSTPDNENPVLFTVSAEIHKITDSNVPNLISPLPPHENRNLDRSSTPDIIDIENPRSMPDIEDPVILTASDQIHKRSLLLTSKTQKLHDCENSIEGIKSKHMLALNSSLLDNIDIASDFDFSLPGSPSTNRTMAASPFVEISNLLQIHSRPASNASTPTSRNTISPAFKNHLFAPKSLDFGNKRKLKGEKMPLAISSEKWRLFVKEKDDEKEKLMKQREERKKRIEINKAEKLRKKSELDERRKNKKRTIKKKMNSTSLLKNTSSQIIKYVGKETILCNGCEEELISDIEEDELKNIGCDKCPKWFHLKCTTKRGKKYDDVAKDDFVCHHCLLHLI